MTQPKHNYKPGQAYKMRNGEKAVFVGEHPFDPETLLFAHDNGQSNIEYYNRDGSWLRDGTKSSLDIIGEWPPEPRKFEGWLVILKPKREGEQAGLYLHHKDDYGKPMGNNLIAIIPIEFTEGDGL